MTKTAPKLAALISALAIQAVYAEPIPCQGRYNVVSGNVIISSSGIVHIEPHNKSEGTIDFIYEGCDRIKVEGQGMSMNLVRSANSGWNGTLTGGGATRVYNFDATTPRDISSWMDAFGGGIKVQRGMQLTLVNATEGQPTDCIFDGDRQNFSKENAAAQAFMSSRSLVPPSDDFSQRDYFLTTETEHDVVTESRKGSTMHIRFLMSSENAILPGTRNATRFREICQAEKGELEPPRRILNFKIHEIENPDGYIIIAQIMDIETGLVYAQRNATVIGRDSEAITEGMLETAAQMNANGDSFGPLTDGKTQ